MNTTVPNHILKAAAHVLENELQALEHCVVDWSDPSHRGYLAECRDVRDWLTSNGYAVTEFACSNHQQLFDRFLQKEVA